MHVRALAQKNRINFREQFEEAENIWTDEAENTSSKMVGYFIQVNNNLKTAKRDIVVVLYKIIFETEGDQVIRKRLRSILGEKRSTCLNI